MHCTCPSPRSCAFEGPLRGRISARLLTRSLLGPESCSLTSWVVLSCDVNVAELNPFGSVLCSRFEVLRGVRARCVSQSRPRAFWGLSEGLGRFRWVLIRRG